jgi:uncharacterized protein
VVATEGGEARGAAPAGAGSRVAIAGATGLIGSALVESLRRAGSEVARITRSPERPADIAWDPGRGFLEKEKLDGVGVVVNLAGSNIGRRWTPAVKAEARQSRVQGTSLLCETLASLPRRPTVLINASAIGYFGDRGDEPLTEDSAPGTGFLADLVRDWEAATRPASDAGIRVVLARFGIVISAQGGALPRLLTPFQLGVGGRIGDGTQWMSWVSMPDLQDAVGFAITTPEIAGPINVVAPNAVRNAEFTRILGGVLRRPTLLPVPETALSLMFGEMAQATLLASQRVFPRRLQEAGFTFQHPQLREALQAALETRAG